MTPDLNRRIAVGAGWLIVLRWSDRLIGIASIAILARLLLPADFGLVGYAMVFLAILETSFMFSFETVLIRDQDATADRYNTVWTLEVLKGLVFAAILVLSAPTVATFFKEPQVESILYWIAAVPALKGLVNVGTVNFQKDLELHKEFYFTLFSRLGGTLTSLALALWLRNFWALVYGTLVHYVLRLLLSYVMSSFRPKLCLSDLSRVFNFSKWLLIQNLVAGISVRLPTIIIGRYLNAQAVGIYNMALEISSLAASEFAGPIRRALYPGIAKMQDDHQRMSDTMNSTLGVIALVGLPVTIGLGVTAPLFIPLILGNNWIEVAPIITVLAVHTAAFMVYPNSHVIYYALDRPDITAKINMLRLAILAPAVLLAVPEYGILGAAWSRAGSSWLILIIDYIILLRMTSIKLSEVFSSIWRSSLAVIIMAVCVTIAIEHPPIPETADFLILHLAFSVFVGVTSYLAPLLMFWLLAGRPDGAEAFVLRTIGKELRRFSSNRLAD